MLTPTLRPSPGALPGGAHAARPSLRPTRRGLLLGLLAGIPLAALAACDASSSQTAPTGMADAAPEDAAGDASTAPPDGALADVTPRTGHVMGRVVGPDGTGLAALKVLACTESTCVRGETDADGRYDIDGLLLLPQKMEVFGSPKGYVDFYYFQDVTADNPNTAPRDVVTFPLPDTTPWPKDQGGAVSVAGGALTLEADAGGFRYPLGAAQEVGAVQVSAEDLPPLDSEPWQGRAAETVAFVVHPLGITATEGAAFRVATVGAALPPGAPYTAYTVDSKHGTLEEIGALTVSPDGELIIPRAMALTKLGQLIFVPAG